MKKKNVILGQLLQATYNGNNFLWKRDKVVTPIKLSNGLWQLDCLMNHVLFWAQVPWEHMIGVLVHGKTHPNCLGNDDLGLGSLGNTRLRMSWFNLGELGAQNMVLCATWLGLSLNALLGELAPRGQLTWRSFLGVTFYFFHPSHLWKRKKKIWKKFKPWTFGVKRKGGF